MTNLQKLNSSAEEVKKDDFEQKPLNFIGALEDEPGNNEESSEDLISGDFEPQETTDGSKTQSVNVPSPPPPGTGSCLCFGLRCPSRCRKNLQCKGATQGPIALQF